MICCLWGAFIYERKIGDWYIGSENEMELQRELAKQQIEQKTIECMSTDISEDKIGVMKTWKERTTEGNLE